MIFTESEPLTREQLKWLRAADRVSFHRDPKLSCIITRKETDVRDADGRRIDEYHELPVASKVREIREEGGDPIADVAYCSHLIWADTGGDDSRYWRTIAKLLKAGDRLEVFWGRNYGSTPLIREANLFADRLTLHAHRGDDRLTFIIPTTINANNTARLIRRGRNNQG